MIMLSKREKEILDLIFNDYSSKEIATITGLSFHTISTHRKNIIEKLNVKSLYGAFKKIYT